MTFKLNDPSVKAAYETRREVYRARAREAMQSEKSIQAEGLGDADEIVNRLADIAAALEASNSEIDADPIEQAERSVLTVLNKVRDDGQSIGRALRALNNALGKCSESTKIEIVAGLAQAGVDPDSLSAGLASLQAVAHTLGGERRRKIKQGKVTSKRTVAIQNAWGVLEKTGCDLQAGGRVIGLLLDGDASQSECIYQAIQKIRTKAGR